MLEAKVRIRHPCPFGDLSGLFPDARMEHWPNGETDVLHVSISSRSRLNGFLMEARARLRFSEWSAHGSQAFAIMPDVRRPDVRAVVEVARLAGVWTVPPITYLGGWETHRIVATTKRSLARFVNEMRQAGEVDLVSVRREERLNAMRDFGILAAHLLGGLTDRQVHALVSAYESGLFDIPSRVGQRRVAQGEGMARSTYGEHLQKAQRILLHNAYPFLKVRDTERFSNGPGRRTAQPGSTSGRTQVSVAPSHVVVEDG